jgi:hypothetical protein
MLFVEGRKILLPRIRPWFSDREGSRCLARIFTRIVDECYPIKQ